MAFDEAEGRNIHFKEGVALNLNLNNSNDPSAKYREICDTVCSDDTNKVFATCLFLCDIHHQNGTQTGNHLLN
uniref:Hypotheticial protein n=1 Tax=Schistosoma japonicum TaxID=6182 RepID=C1LTS4_SCHJA|nr:hypotheticial protein [Schistosoma japonicum]